MGKTANDMSCQAPSREEGEITLLAEEGVGNIDQYAGEEYRARETSFGSPEDDQAIGNITIHLRRTRSGERLSSEELQDLSIDLYNRVCDQIRSNKLSWDQIKKSADIFGEDPDQLSQRLHKS